MPREQGSGARYPFSAYPQGQAIITRMVVTQEMAFLGLFNEPCRTPKPRNPRRFDTIARA